MTGGPRMVDVGEKPPVPRVAVVSGTIRLRPATIDAILQGTLEKGDVLATSKVAGIAAAKHTASLLPLCHPLSLTMVNVAITVEQARGLVCVTSEVHAVERTGVEMEALVATTAALLNVWDMTKSLEKDENGQYPVTAIESITVVRKVKG